MSAAVVLPGVPALLPAYAGLSDPVADLRAACMTALHGLVERGVRSVRVIADPVDAGSSARGVADPLGLRIVESLLGEVGFTGEIRADAEALVVVANGSARRGEKAPGHLDERSFDHDTVIDKALRAGDGAALAGLDVALGAELLANGVSALVELGRLVPRSSDVVVSYDDDPFGVRYWVVSWR